MQWMYEGKQYTELTTGVHGFIYKITVIESDGTYKFYIGKKDCFKKLTLPALKSGEIRKDAERIGKNKNGKRVYFDILKKESNWQDYESSSDEVGNRVVIKKEILELAPTKRSLTYLEEKYLFLNNVLEDENYLNKQIGNRYFKGRLL